MRLRPMLRRIGEYRVRRAFAAKTMAGQGGIRCICPCRDHAWQSSVTRIAAPQHIVIGACFYDFSSELTRISQMQMRNPTMN